MSDDNVAVNLEKLGLLYENQYLSKVKELDLEQSCWDALKFFFDHSFMRGRRDELSIEYLEFTNWVLRDYFNSKINNSSEKLYNQIKSSKDKNLFQTEKMVTI